jgi:hypothetical protein
LDDADAAAGKVDSLGRIADVDRGVPVQHDEDLFLDVLGMALAARSGRVAPELRAALLLQRSHG